MNHYKSLAHRGAVRAGEESHGALPVAAAAAGGDGRDETWKKNGEMTKNPGRNHGFIRVYMV